MTTPEQQRISEIRERLSNRGVSRMVDIEFLLSQLEERDKRLDSFWFMVENGWDIEPRSYFESEAPKSGDWSPEGMAAHHMWKRDRKVAELEADKRMLDWLQATAETAFVSMCFEVDGGVHVTIDPVGSEQIAARNQDTIRDGIAKLMKDTSHDS